LDDSLVDGVWQQLEQAMAQRQLYLRSSLTLAELAAELGHSGNELSQVINSRSGGNFFEYVNRYRVEQAKALLAQPQYQEQKMLAIALDAGFNSQSTFYTHFRKHTGVTPRQYRQQLGR
jgi:AraC-like DNA-binding protein